MPETPINEYCNLFAGEHYVRMDRPAISKPDWIILPESKATLVKR